MNMELIDQMLKNLNPSTRLRSVNMRWPELTSRDRGPSGFAYWMLAPLVGARRYGPHTTTKHYFRYFLEVEAGSHRRQNTLNLNTRFNPTSQTRHHGFRSTRHRYVSYSQYLGKSRVCWTMRIYLLTTPALQFQAKKVCRRWCLLRRVERVLPTRVGRGGILRS
jgi:hypothetical protein